MKQGLRMQPLCLPRHAMARGALPCQAFNTRTGAPARQARTASSALR